MDLSDNGFKFSQKGTALIVRVEGVPLIHEDEHFIVVNKPPGMLSQPGRTIYDSVETRIRQALGIPSEPVLVHRLDMDTSGLMLLAKNRSSHRHLQQQFEKRRIGKRYRALLEKMPEALGGLVDLPLRLDIENRPKQLVCFEYGKNSTTAWHRDPAAINGVVLYPLTGRSHQLRVHLADPFGLGIPIKGDRLYGSPDFPDVQERMMLHADFISFDHPVSGRRMKLFCPAPFV